MTDDDRFLARRRKLAMLGVPVAVGCLIALLAGYVTMWFRVPLLANPWHAIDGVQRQTIEQSTLELMAVFTPILFSAVCCLLAFMMVLLICLTVLERRYLAILGRSLADRPSGPSDNPRP